MIALLFLFLIFNPIECRPKGFSKTAKNNPGALRRFGKPVLAHGAPVLSTMALYLGFDALAEFIQKEEPESNSFLYLTGCLALIILLALLKLIISICRSPPCTSAPTGQQHHTTEPPSIELTFPYGPPIRPLFPLSSFAYGEVVRLVLEDLTRRGLLFSGDHSQIAELGCFPTKLVSDIEGQMQNDDEENPFHKIEELLQDIGIWNSTPADCANVAYVCSLVSARAAHFCACGIAALLKRMGRPTVTVGVDGSVYRFHPTFKFLLDHKIDELVEGKYEFVLVLSEDGSGRGAAVAAAVASRMNRIMCEHHRELRQ
ncbi:hypothetical protein niasHT_030369 [Heterodera trifolii]|uniref:Phosphotransferase n=1 Tax=Heterodera trifolii TaxID=157864 RepID=A0ABD2KPX8_9BILA